MFALKFLIIAAVFGILGFFVLNDPLAMIGRVLCYIFVLLFVIRLLMGRPVPSDGHCCDHDHDDD